MAEELNVLYTTFSTFKQSVIKKFDKIDAILQNFSSYGDPNSSITVANKYDISKNMLEVLSSYTEILFLLDSTLAELERGVHPDSPPAKDASTRANSNPFYSPVSPVSSSVSFSFHSSEMELVEDSLCSDVDTIVGCNSDTVTPDPLKSEDEVMGAGIENTEEAPVEQVLTEVKAEDEVETPKHVSKIQVGQPPCEADYSAADKLLNINVHKRREEEKKFESTNVVKDFKCKEAQSPVNNVPEKKKKQKKLIIDVKDNDLAANQTCCFSYVATPMEFYLRTNQELFESLDNYINQKCDHQQDGGSDFKTKTEAKAAIGNFGLVFMPRRRKWVRVQVIDWMDSEVELILVQLIDYGEKFTCKYVHLKCMTHFYSQYPKMAIKCHFAGMQTPELTERWPQESIDALIRLSEMDQKSSFSIIFLRKEGDSYAVDLRKEGCDKTLREVLVERGLAKQKQVAESKLGDISEDKCNLNEAIGCDAQVETSVCPFTDDSGKCSKDPSCKLEHSKPSTDGVATKKPLVAVQAPPELVVPSPGEFIEILITGYINTCHFYGHIYRGKTNSSLFNVDFQKLQDLMNSINMVHTYEAFTVSPAVGEVVLLQHEQRWHRAICVEHVGENMLVLFAVDFGQTLLKQLTDIRKIKAEFLHLAFQAVECILDSCSEHPNVSLQNSRLFFDTCMYFKVFKGFVTGGRKPLRLKLFDNRNLDMDYVLKGFGLAQDRIQNLFPGENAVLQKLGI